MVCPLLVLVTVFSETIQPYLMSQVIDRGVMAADVSVITRIGVMMVAISLAGMAVNMVNVRISSGASTGFGTDLRAALFHKIQSLSFPDIDRFSSASLVTRLTNDVGKIQQLVLMSMRIMLRAPMMLVMAMFFVVRINPTLALVLLAAIPLLAGGVWIILRKGFPYFVRVQRKVDQLNAVVRENLINIRVVKSFVREEFETGKFNRTSEELRDMVIRASNIVILIFPLMQLVLNLSIIAVLWFGGLQVSGGKLSVGELISFVNYLTQVLMSLMMLSMVVMTVARASASSQRIVEVLDAQPSLADTPAGRENNARIERGEVSFRGVHFRYAGGETDVLRNITFDVRAGETIAVAGATGSAKTSMVQLIPRLYDVSEGAVMIDGVDVRDYPLDELHRAVGVVLQQNELFSGTILENLRWGDPSASREAVETAARAAAAHDFIHSFADGYDTVLGRGGVNISGGQKQRLCIARALLRKPKVLILDDSTSAVDAQTELEIRQNLRRMLGGVTVFVITQRIGTMQTADRVLVLDDGRVDALGAPDELMRTSTLYREIVRSQQYIQ